MEMETVKKSLEEVGFDNKEIQVYLSLLKIGETSATKISKETKIERTLVYYIIEKLINRGLVSFNLKNNVKAKPPIKLIRKILVIYSSRSLWIFPYLNKSPKSSLIFFGYKPATNLDILTQ